KTMSGAYMNSMLTQIERRFDIPASLVGVINGSFEMGDLLVIAFVSYLGAKLHRPRMIALGCIVMSLGCLLISLPHFLMGRYQYETMISSSENSSSSMTICLLNQTQSSLPTEMPSEDCKKKAGSLMWVFVLAGNIIRGVGETPITPLGISYVEDFAKAENSPFYIGKSATTVLGPFLGLMMGSFCAQLYVDIGFIDDVTLSLTDARWVGAWWLGALICALLNLLVGIPFCFLPKSLPKEGEETDVELSTKRKLLCPFIPDFIPFVKSLLCNPVYMLFIGVTVIQFSAFIGMFSFMPKYLEQQYGKSASDAIFLIAVYNLPIICTGYFLGGLLMKKFKINNIQSAHIAFWTSVLEYLIYFSAFLMICNNSPVAGLTVSYEGIEQISYVETNLYADCNSGCDCSVKAWDPVCGDNGITYVSACLAGCTASNGTGKSMIFDNCTCVASSGISSGNASAVLGHCARGESCDTMLQYFLIMSFVCCLIYSLGAMPGYMVLIRSLKPEEKSFGVGIHTLATRILAGIPAPIYFGALIDTTCLKWGTKSCGGEGSFPYPSIYLLLLYLGVPAVLRGLSYIPCVFILLILKRQFKSSKGKNSESSMEMEVKGPEND
uniref:Solute carrier organic anion transporter family member n=1 Tax=Sphenodon punctatus TaxID=8508 RepID=A0A8D0HUL7_SPHPU